MKVTELTKPGEILVCMACGKTARNMMGAEGSYGWDESCMLNCVVAKSDYLVKDEHGKVVEIKEGGVVDDT